MVARRSATDHIALGRLTRLCGVAIVNSDRWLVGHRDRDGCRIRASVLVRYGIAEGVGADKSRCWRKDVVTSYGVDRNRAMGWLLVHCPGQRAICTRLVIAAQFTLNRYIDQGGVGIILRVGRIINDVNCHCAGDGVTVAVRHGDRELIGGCRGGASICGRRELVRIGNGGLVPAIAGRVSHRDLAVRGLNLGRLARHQSDAGSTLRCDRHSAGAVTIFDIQSTCRFVAARIWIASLGQARLMD